MSLSANRAPLRRDMRQKCNEAFTFNLVFTRVVNHCVTVLGIKGLARQDGGASRWSRLAPILKVDYEL